MATRRKVSVSNSRLQLGADILTAARAVDTTLIKDRLATFESAQQTCVAAQARVDAADGELRVLQMKIAELDLDQDEAVERLAVALVNDGQPRAKPFAVFGAPPPAALMKLAATEAALAVHALVATLQRSKGLSKATQQAMREVDAAASAVEKAAEPMPGLQNAAREARHTRDVFGQAWESALAALRRGARSAVDEGGAHLYPALFATRARTPKAKPAPSSVAATQSPVVAAAANATAAETNASAEK